MNLMEFADMTERARMIPSNVHLRLFLKCREIGLRQEKVHAEMQRSISVIKVPGLHRLSTENDVYSLMYLWHILKVN